VAAKEWFKKTIEGTVFLFWLGTGTVKNRSDGEIERVEGGQPPFFSLMRTVSDPYDNGFFFGGGMELWSTRVAVCLRRVAANRFVPFKHFSRC
jgi:hypothetical protein